MLAGEGPIGVAGERVGVADVGDAVATDMAVGVGV